MFYYIPSSMIQKKKHMQVWQIVQFSKIFDIVIVRNAKALSLMMLPRKKVKYVKFLRDFASEEEVSKNSKENKLLQMKRVSF